MLADPPDVVDLLAPWHVMKSPVFPGKAVHWTPSNLRKGNGRCALPE
jgi:hypothetical protein